MQGLTNHDVATRLLDGMATYAEVLANKEDLSTVLRTVHNMMWEFPEQNWIDAFSKYQILSKKWLLDEVHRLYYSHFSDSSHIHGDTYVLGGWLGTLPYMMTNRGMTFTRVISVDIDPSVASVAERLNANVGIGRVVGVTANANDLNYTDDSFPERADAGFIPSCGSADLIINTSCEHFTDYEGWIEKVPKQIPVVLQSNNMFGIDGHVNCKATLREFLDDCGLDRVMYANSLDLGDKWQRHMIIGSKV